MAKVSLKTIETIRQTAKNLEKNPSYQWGHMGSCNCGFLAQQITHLRKEEIHTRAMERHGDWNEQLNDYCPSSGLRMDDLISEMLAFGFDIADLKHLERLSDPEVLKEIPLSERNLKHNVKSDVVKYLHAWANELEKKMLNKIKLQSLVPDAMVAV